MIANLPSGRGMVADGNDGLEVTVMWDDDGTGANGTGCDPTNANDLTCYTLVVAEQP